MNSLEEYCILLRKSLNNENNSLKQDDKNKITKLVIDTLAWIDDHCEEEEAELFEAKQREVESISIPIMQAAHQAA